MAINKKLKKFDDNGTYRNFLTTSDFERPDVSSIGAGSVPQNLDVEYNPTRMLFLNAKYRLFPTSTKIEFVIDTITNGTVGCWYKPSTGSTYTKLNSTDLTFYSAYTQNRVTNLTFDTVGISSLSDECNIVYVLSAKSSSDASVTKSDTCVQRGLISLTGENFPSSGGSISYQIKTAPENPWKITNTNSWLTFSTLTGTGPTTVVITATEWSDTSQGRTGTVTLEYTDMEYSVQATITQNKLNKYFYVGNSAAQATTTACTYASTVGSADTSDKYVYYKMAGYTISSLSLVKDEMFSSASFDSGDRIKFALSANPNHSDRTGTILVKDGSTIISQITVTQQAKRVDYFYVGNTLAEATTTACTYASIVGSGDTSDKYVYYKTNLTDAEVAGLTIEKDDMFENVNIVIATTQVKFNCKQNGEEEYFYFTVDSGTTKSFDFASASTSTTYGYATNMTGLTVTTPSENWLTVSLSNPTGDGNVNITVTANTGSTRGPLSVYIQQDGINLATVTVSQQAKAYFLWSNNATAITKSIGSGTTADSTTYTTNMTGLTLTSGGSYSWVTAKGITNTAGNGTFSATTQENSTTTARTAEFLVKTGSTTVGTLNLQQSGLSAPYVYMCSGSAADATQSACTYDDDIDESGGSGEFNGKTNYTAEEVATLTLSASSDFTQAILSYDCSSRDSLGYCTLRVRFSLGRNSRKTLGKDMYIKSGTTLLAQMTVYQYYTSTEIYGYWDGTSHGSQTITWRPGAGGGSNTLYIMSRYDGYPIEGPAPWTASTSGYDWLSVSPRSGSGGWSWDSDGTTVSCSANNTGSERIGWVQFYNDDSSDSVRVIQPG